MSARRVRGGLAQRPGLVADRSDCSAYDCEYVALAKRLGVKLVTMDRKVLRAFPEVAVSLAGTADHDGLVACARGRYSFPETVRDPR